MLMTRLQRFLLWGLKFARGPAISAGILCGLMLLCVVIPLRLRLGMNHEVDSAMILTAAICCWLVRCWVVRRPVLQRWRFNTSLLFLAAALWTLLVPTILSGLMHLVERLSVHHLEQFPVSLGVLVGVTFLCLAPACCVLCLSFLQSSTCDSVSRWQWLFALAVACLLSPVVVWSLQGTFWLAWVGLIFSSGWAVWDLYCKRSRSVPKSAPVRPGSVSEQTALVSVSTVRLPLRRAYFGLLGIAIGSSLALSGFIASQLIPRNFLGDMSLLAGFLMGIACASVRRPWASAETSSKFVTRESLLLAVWVAVLCGGYPLWTVLCLKMNAWVGQIVILFALRAGLLMALTFPAGFLAGRLCMNAFPERTGSRIPLSIAGGMILTPFVPGSPWLIAAGLILLTLLIATVSWGNEQYEIPVNRWARLQSGGLVGLAILGLLFSRNLNPERSERILFSAAALQSLRQGIAPAQLNWIDDSRPLATFTSLNNHLSLWKQRGSQVLLRRDGMLLGLHSANSTICPHNAGDLLPALLPLVIHPDPANVLVLGIHPPTLLTCHNWPLQKVQCVDGSAQAHQMLDWLMTHPAEGLHLENGPEFQFRQVDSTLALYSQHADQYDLITCPITHPGSAQSVSQMTREFYLQVREHLSQNGIFSQRLPYYDLGPDVVHRVIGTLQSVFGEVRAVESVPGELIFLCSAETLPPIDAAVVERLKAPQTRSLLAQAGWDWSLVLGRGGVDHEGLKSLSKKYGPHYSISHNPLAVLLPVEVSRWGRKGDATRMSLAKYGAALRTSLEDSASGKEVTERLEDLNLAHQIQQNHPNDPWAYRAALKSRLQDRPRAAIMQVNHQLKRVLNPEDQRRKEYLLALAPAARSQNPSPEAIQELADFETPFDPLVSLFVHFETANLFQRCSSPPKDRQLQHLLHTVYYSSNYDQSVRNVADALELLTAHPEAVANQTQRWDEMNSLLQILAQRWQRRLSSVQQSSKYETTDTEYCLRAIEAGIHELSQIYPQAGLTAQEWSWRKQTLEQALLRPLRQHRSEQARQLSVRPPLGLKKSDPTKPESSAFTPEESRSTTQSLADEATRSQ